MQWQHIPTTENAADVSSRGLNMNQNSNIKRWFHGHVFLWKSAIFSHNDGSQYSVDKDDAEVKMTIDFNVTQIKKDVMEILVSRISSWKKMKRIIGYILLFIQKIKESISTNRRQGLIKCEENLSNAERINEGGVMILKLTQGKASAANVATMRSKLQIIDC